MSFEFIENGDLVSQCQEFLTLPLEEQRKAFVKINDDEQFQTWDTACAYHICEEIERFEEGKPVDEKLSNLVLDVGNLFYNLSLDVESDEITPTDKEKTDLIESEINRVFGILEQIEKRSLVAA